MKTSDDIRYENLLFLSPDAGIPLDVKKYFKNAFSVDCVVFGFSEGKLSVLLITRGAEPYKGLMAVPGDLVDPSEDLDDASVRVLNNLTGLSDLYLEQVGAFGEPDRHPYGRVITVAYYSLIKIDEYQVKASSWAKEADWHVVHTLPELAFDHTRIVNAAKAQLKDKVRREPIGFELLPEEFTLSELQDLYQAVLEQEFDKRNFRKKILSMNLLTDTGNLQDNVSHRPAKLFKFDKSKYDSLRVKGFSFEL